MVLINIDAVKNPKEQFGKYEEVCEEAKNKSEFVVSTGLSGEERICWTYKDVQFHIRDGEEKIRATGTSHDLARVVLFEEITAYQFKKEFHSLYSEMIEVLDTKKIKIRMIKMGSNKLEGLTFCFTGKFESMT